MSEDSSLSEPKLLRILRVLECVAGSSNPVTIAQIAMRLGIPKASTARLIELLVRESFLSNIPGERGLVPGPRAAGLALSILGNNTFRRLCRSLLTDLVGKVGETCNISAFDGNSVLYVERVETFEPLRMHLEPGSRHPLHCTAGGKLFLAQMPPSERRAVLDKLQLPPRTPHTLISRPTLEAELDQLARRGIGIECEEFVVGMVGVAVPVRLSAAPNSLALVCHAASARMGLNQLLGYLPVLHDAAARLQDFVSAEYFLS